MNRDGTNRIIHMGDVIIEPHGEHHEQSGYRADNRRAGTVRHITGGCDCHQTRQRCIQAHGDIRLSVFEPGKQHADYRCHGGRYSRCQED